MIVQPYNVRFDETDNLDGFIATIEEFSGCYAIGGTREIAVNNLRDSIIQWLNDAVANKQNIPAPEKQYYLSIGVSPNGTPVVLMPFHLERLGGF